MIVCSITGTRTPPWRRLPQVDDVLRAVVADRFVTGGQWGIDVYAAEVLLELHAKAEHLIVCPDAPCAWPAVARLEAEFGDRRILRVVRPARSGLPPAAAYRARDEAVVLTACGGGEGSFLLAFPLRAEKHTPRSGTWLTVRTARRAGLPVREVVLDRSEEAVPYW